MTSKPRIAVACGGTGGHLFPGLAVARALAAHGCEITLLVSSKDVDQQALKGVSAYRIEKLPAVGLARGSRLAFGLGFGKSYLFSRALFKNRGVDAAIAMGGFTSAPVLLAARKFKAPTFLHESNSVPGRANRWLAPKVDAAFVGFPECARRLKAKKVIVSGTPVREEIRPAHKASSRQELGLAGDKPTLLIMGGSQGASAINRLAATCAPLIKNAFPGLQIIHLTGRGDEESMREIYQREKVPAVVAPFFQRMDIVLGAADLVVSRSGASSLAEFAAAQLPPILIPYPTAADDHQYHNAKAFVDSGAAVLLDQFSSTPEKLVALLKEGFGPGAARMRESLQQWHQPAAADTIAQAMLKSLKGFSGPFPVRKSPQASNEKPLQCEAVLKPGEELSWEKDSYNKKEMVVIS